MQKIKIIEICVLQYAIFIFDLEVYYFVSVRVTLTREDLKFLLSLFPGGQACLFILVRFLGD